MDAEDLLYLLYTSGTTGKPKGIAHTTGGYMTQVAATHRMIFDIHDDDVYWCAADIGWVTGHSYIVYGPLANHTTGHHVRGGARLARQGPAVGHRRAVPGHDPLHGPHRDPGVHAMGHRASRGSTTCRRCGCSARSASRSIRRPGSGTGRSSAAERCPIVDTWWQTETGAILITPLPGHHAPQAGLGHLPVPRDRGGRRRRGRRESVPSVAGATSCSAAPVARRSPARSGAIPIATCETYFSQYGPEVYVAGDGARRDEDGYFWLLGRIDDVMNVAGHRLSTFEIESALVDDHEGGGGGRRLAARRPQGRGASSRSSRLKAGIEGDDAMLAELREHVAEDDRPDRQPARHHLHAPTCRRRVPARSCAGCCATSLAATRWAT